MTITSTVHSNATNFMSFVQNGVDPRTGQYTLGIELPALTGNDLIGPDLPLRLAFNPLNDQDSGFGGGWTLALSQYTPASQMLHLHTGESFKVTGSGEQPTIREKKLDTFHLHYSNDSEQGERYRIVHKTGMVEVLTARGVGVERVFLPEWVHAASGHWIKLGYTDYQGKPCLQSIVDGNGRHLLQITYSLGGVTFDLHPGTGPDGTAFARYELELVDREVTRITLPSEDRANWRLAYDIVNDLRCLVNVQTPTGAVEQIIYDPDGHSWPTNDTTRSKLPRVKEHLVMPGFGQPQMKTTYRYSDENFVGFNSGVIWQDDGEDNLYRARSSYRYWTETTQWSSDAPVRKQTQIYNRHHLMMLQTLEQDGHIEETETVYHESANLDFDAQPAYFQLPHTITKRWRLRHDGSKLRTEMATTCYDDYGNLIEECQPTGIRTRYEYYPLNGESKLCPADPQGFVRNLKCVTVYPLTEHDGDAPIMRRRMTYAEYSPLTNHLTDVYWLGLREEQLLQVDNTPEQNEQLRQLTEIAFLEQPSNGFLHGRIDHQLTTRYDSTSEDPLARVRQSRTNRIDWHYSKVNHPKFGVEYWQKQTLTGFDMQQKRLSQAVSPLHGQTTYEQDDYDNAIRYRYDNLGRLVERTVAPDSADQSITTHYDYALVASSGSQAKQKITEPTGVITSLEFDGLNRVLLERREVEVPRTPLLPDDPVERKEYVVAQRNYDDLGRVHEEIEFDDIEGRSISLKSTYAYDAWGELCTTTLPAGVTLHRERWPFDSEGDQLTSWMETPDKPGVRQQQVCVQSNRFDKPAWTERVDEKGKTVQRTEYQYDGLGRTIADTLRFQTPKGRPIERSHGYRYDAWGRMSETDRPDRSTLIRTFALHSGKPLTEQLMVRRRPGDTPKATWMQSFDGIGRQRSLAIGKKQESYTYRGDTELVDTRTIGSKRTFHYSYDPNLGIEPVSISVGPSTVTYDYHRNDGAIKSASNTQASRSYEYSDQGYLNSSRLESEAEGDYLCEYAYSLQGRLNGYHDSDGQSVSHDYDSLGRLERTTQGQLEATFCYDSAGRLHTTTTHDHANNQTLLCEQAYDYASRENLRTLTLTRPDGSTVVQTIDQQWRADDQLHSRIVIRDGEQVLLETFDYDALNRLENHTCEGPAAPRNAKGRQITNQFFTYDELNNLTECLTDFADGSVDQARYSYDGVMLEKVEHSLQPDYPASQAFEHDDEGNLLNDELGNRLAYDEMGRLEEVRSADNAQILYRYRYDGHNDLIGVAQGDAAYVQRRYQGYRLSSTLEHDVLTQYLYADDRPLGVHSSNETDNQLLLTDASNSVIAESSAAALHETQYSSYGETHEDSGLRGLLGFNGEARERALGWYLLGRGYRAYNPSLMRFHSPDTLSPEIAGINPYAYCSGNPVNWRDPTGHYGQGHSVEYPHIPVKTAPKSNWRAWVALGLSAVTMVASVALMIAFPPVGTLATILSVASLTTEGTGNTMQVIAAFKNDESLADKGFWVQVAGAVASFAVIGFNIVAARSATNAVRTTRSVGTSTDATRTARSVGTSTEGLGDAAGSVTRLRAGDRFPRTQFAMPEGKDAYKLNRNVSFSDIDEVAYADDMQIFKRGSDASSISSDSSTSSTSMGSSSSGGSSGTNNTQSTSPPPAPHSDPTNMPGPSRLVTPPASPTKKWPPVKGNTVLKFGIQKRIIGI